MNSDEPFFRQVVDELPDLVCRLAPDGTLRYVNNAYAEYFGSTPEALVDTSFLDLVPPGQRAEVETDLLGTTRLTPERPSRVTEHRGGDRDGEVRWQQWVDKASFDADGRLVELVSVGRDVTERRAAETMLRYYSERDPLTGLLNRRTTLAALDEAVADAHESATDLVGLVYIDLDCFKQINDRDGHRAGDRILTLLADVLVTLFGMNDAIGRLGGDEFVVVCTTTPSPRDLEARGARLQRQVALLGGPVTASIGVALLEPGEDAASLLHRADLDMYRRKQQARRARETLDRVEASASTRAPSALVDLPTH